MDVLAYILIFCCGAAIGSFLNVVILRLPREKSLGGRSACESCGETLSAIELVPLLSFLILRGRCGHCGAKISKRYFAIELATALLFLAAWLFLLPDSAGDLIIFVKWAIALSLLLVVFVTDLEYFLIFDSVVFIGAGIISALNLILDIVLLNQVFSIHSFFVGGLLAAVFAALPFFAVWLVSKGSWMGDGDVKLALLLGVILGWPLVWVGLFLAVILGGIVSIFLLAARKKQLKSPVPFGVFLSFAAALALFYGQPILSWYLARLGF